MAAETLVFRKRTMKIFIPILIVLFMPSIVLANDFGLGGTPEPVPVKTQLFGLESSVVPVDEFEIQWVSEYEMVKQCDEFGCRYVPKLVRRPVRVRKQRTVERTVQRSRTVKQATPGGSTGNVAVKRTVSRSYGGSTGQVSYGST